MYNTNQEISSASANGRCCFSRVICIVAAALLFVIGVIVGAFVAPFIILEIAAVAVFAIVIAFILALLLIFKRCRR